MSAIDISEQGHNYDKQTMASLPPTPSTILMTAEKAKKIFFDHWAHIDALAKRRFPGDENLQLEATDYVHNKLADDDWKKLRAFKGKDKQLTAFISTVTSCLLTDFWRNKVGYQRPNTWLKRQNDQIYQKAYKLLVKDRYSKREAVEIIFTTETEREPWKIEEIVSEVLAHCPIKVTDQTVPLDDDDVDGSDLPHTSLEDEFAKRNEQTLLEVLLCILNEETDEDDIQPDVKELKTYIAKYVGLTEEESLILRLRYSDGKTAKEIGRLLNLTGPQVDKLIKRKILPRLHKAFKRAGLLSNEY